MAFSFPQPQDPDWHPEISDEVPEEAIATPLPEELVVEKPLADRWKEIAS